MGFYSTKVGTLWSELYFDCNWQISAKKKKKHNTGVGGSHSSGSGTGRDFPPVFSWDWDGKRLFFVGVGRERFENSLPCHPLIVTQKSQKWFLITTIFFFLKNLLLFLIKFLLIFYHLLNIQNNIGKQSVVKIQINLQQPLTFKLVMKHWRSVRQVENCKLQPKRGTVKREIEKKQLTFYFWSNSSPKMSLFSELHSDLSCWM